MKQKIIDGKLGIARIEGRYELVPSDIADKIRQRNDKRIVLFEPEQQASDDDDPYAEFQVPKVVDYSKNLPHGTGQVKGEGDLDEAGD